MALKIGELARRTGLTVRALHHYNAIGLLVPSARSDNGYRLYDGRDVARLYRIQALRRLDLPLVQIAALLDGDPRALGEAVERRLGALDQEIRRASALREHLLEVKDVLQESREPALDEGLAALERLVAEPAYFSDEQLARMKARRGKSASHGKKAGLAAELHALRERGASASDEPSIALARRWIALLLEEAGGDEGALMQLYAMHRSEPALHALTGVDPAGMAFISQAMAHARLALYGRHCTRAEMARVRRHYAAQVGAWPPLIDAVRRHMRAGEAPGCAPMQALAGRWRELSLAKAGGDPALADRLDAAFRREPALRRGSGIDLPLLDYVDQAQAASAAQPADHPAAASLSLQP